ncbi:MAG: hypothetical protein LBG60_01590 [Bifidobacteriaceae bacterium]|jgi:hypothetical protein|nr:hypothetical protein [Bifidobacteriaceae bacterium]
MTMLYTIPGTIHHAVHAAAMDLVREAAAKTGRALGIRPHDDMAEVQILGHIAQAAIILAVAAIDNQRHIEWDIVANALGVTPEEAQDIYNHHIEHPS